MSTALTSGFHLTFSMTALSAVLCFTTGFVYQRIGRRALLISLVGHTHAVIDVLRCIYLGLLYSPEVRSSPNFPGWMAVVVCIAQFWNTAFNMAALFANMHLFLLLVSERYRLDIRRSVTLMACLGFAVSSLNLIITYAVINTSNYFDVPFQYINFIILLSLIVLGLPSSMGVVIILIRNRVQSASMLARGNMSMSLCYRLMFNSVGLAIITSSTLQANFARLGQATTFTPPYELANQSRFLPNSFLGILFFVVLITSDESMSLIREAAKKYLGIEIPQFTIMRASQMTEHSVVRSSQNVSKDVSQSASNGQSIKGTHHLSSKV